MGVSVFPAPSTSTSTPGDSNRAPKFTYSASYDLSSLSGMNNIQSTNTAMTYRRVDGCIYFTSGSTNNLWKFNTSTNTGSYVSNTLSWSGAKDIVSAYDGTMYAGFSNPSNASPETLQYSTDAGVSWNYFSGSGSAGTKRGFIGLVDSGEIPGISGNLTHQHAGGTAADSCTWWYGTTKAANNLQVQNTSYFNQTYYGGRAVFPLRDGDDVKTGTNGIWLGTVTSSDSFAVARNGAPVTIRPASYNVYGITTGTISLAFSVNPVTTGYNASSSQYAEPCFMMNKPTTIDSRWIVGVNSQSMNELHVIDFKTLKSATNVALPYTGTSTSYAAGAYTANPIYVSATKKLYVLQANSDGSANTSKMHVYDVTTY